MTAQVLVLCLVQQLTTQAGFLLSGGQGQGLMQALLRSLQPKCSVTKVQQQTQQRHKGET